MERGTTEGTGDPGIGAPAIGLGSRVLLAFIALYQATLSRLILAVFGPVCRFQPSCSRYAVECIVGHGALRGSLLSLKRLCRCHPFHPGGFDPPPAPRPRAGSKEAVSLSTSPPTRATPRGGSPVSVGTPHTPVRPLQQKRTRSGPTAERGPADPAF